MRALTAWWRAQTPGSQAFALLLAALPVSLVVALLWSGAALAFTALSGVPTTATALPTPTWTPFPIATFPMPQNSPTATRDPHAVSPPSGATLGGPSDAFLARYGVEVSAEVWDITTSAGPAQLQIQSVVDANGQVASADGVNRVFAVSLSFTGPTPGVAVVTRACAAFLPPGSHHLSGQNYTSASLAAAFTSDAPDSFASGAPGTFTEDIGATHCDLLIGEG